MGVTVLNAEYDVVADDEPLKETKAIQDAQEKESEV